MIYSKYRLLFFPCLLVVVHFSILAQPYYNTSIPDDLVKENTFIVATPNLSVPPEYELVKGNLPQPFWEDHDEVVRCYWKTWEIAFSNLKQVSRTNGFVAPYIDPAFNDNIFMWDCSFMTMFGKYGTRTFNFQGTLDNFYSKQHSDGFICREIRGADGTDVFAKFDVSSTGPNIMPWSEWEYFLNTGDLDRLRKVFPVLLAYYQWYNTNRTWQDGTYFSSGWGCGMDNQPRMHPQYNQEFSHGFMSWIDVTLQEIFAGGILIKMAQELDREDDVKTIVEDVATLKSIVNSNMWDEKESYYFDRYRDGTLSKVKSIASFWALLADVVPEQRKASFVRHLADTAEFARKHRVPTLSASDPNFDPQGDYWNGSVWAPTNYMVLRGLTRQGFDSLAYEIGRNHLDNVVEVFSKTDDLRENYAPDFVQGNDRSEFVGWTGLAPINVMIEYVFGIRPNVPENTLVIDVNLIDSYGVEQYPFGQNGLLDITIRKRKSESQRPIVTIRSNQSLKVIVKWEGGNFEKNIKAGLNVMR